MPVTTFDVLEIKRRCTVTLYHGAGLNDLAVFLVTYEDNNSLRSDSHIEYTINVTLFFFLIISFRIRCLGFDGIICMFGA